MKNKVSKLFLILFILALPLGAFAQNPDAGVGMGQFIPCDGVTVPCDFGALMKLVQNILNWLVIMAFPVSVITFAYAGFIYLTTGIVDKRSQAKEMLIKVVIGFVFILAAWLIVKIIVSVLLTPGIGNKFINL